MQCRHWGEQPYFNTLPVFYAGDKNWKEEGKGKREAQIGQIESTNIDSKNEGAVRSEKEKEGYNTRTSQGVTYPSSTLAQAR